MTYRKENLLNIFIIITFFYLIILVESCKRIKITNHDNMVITLVAAYPKKLIKGNNNVEGYERVKKVKLDCYIPKKTPDQVVFRNNSIKSVFLIENKSNQWWLSVNIDERAKELFYNFTKRNVKAMTVIKINHKIISHTPTITKPLRTNELFFPFLTEPRKIVEQELEKIIK